MANIAGRVTVSVPGADLVIKAPSTSVELIDFGTNGRQWRRRAVQGDYQHGDALLTAVLDVVTITLRVRCKGASWVDTNANRNVLFDALSQRSYTLTTSVEEHEEVWTCEPADIAPMTGDVLGPEWVALRQMEFVASIRAYPVPQFFLEPA